MNEKYRPDVKCFVCTCPHFVVSRFLLCKHLVQQFGPVNPRFFLEVTQNRCVPFWSHPLLIPLPSAEAEAGPSHPRETESDGDDKAQVDKYKWQNLARLVLDNPSSESEEAGNGDEDEDDEEDDEELVLVDMWENEVSSSKKTCKQEMEGHLHMLQEFSDGIEYQLQFQDPRFLKTLEKEGSRFFRLTQSCLSRKRQLNSSRTGSPTTWERSTSNALFYKAWPCKDHTT